MRPGDEVIVLPSGKTSRITAIDGPSGPVSEAFPPMVVTISLADDIDISRGDMITRTNNQPRVSEEFDATICWMADDSALEPSRDYVIKQTTKITRARVTALDYRLDVNTLHRDKSATALKLNELGRITFCTQAPLMLDEYTRNASTGSFILIDPATNVTVAAGMVLCAGIPTFTSTVPRVELLNRLFESLGQPAGFAGPPVVVAHGQTGKRGNSIRYTRAIGRRRDSQPS